MTTVPQAPPASPARIPGLSRQVYWAGILYALIGVASYLAWLVFGTVDGVRNRAPVDLLPYYGLVVLVLALGSGMGQDNLRLRLTRLERICLVVVVIAAGYSMVFTSVDFDSALDGVVIRLPHLALAIGLYFLLCEAGKAAALWMTGAIALQTILHMPIVAALYVTNVDNPVVNWLGGPIGYWHVRMWGIILSAGLAAALGIYAWGIGRGAMAHIAAGVVFTLLWTALFWSGTRSGAFALLAATLVSCALFPRAFLRALPLFIVTGAIGAGLSLLLTLPLEAYGLLQAFDGRDNGLEGLDGVSGGRMRMWSAALGQLGDHPIFGHGFNQYVFVGEANEGHIQPHNALLQLLFDFGYVGGGAAILLIVSLWLHAVVPVVRERQAWKYGALTALHTLMVSSMFDGAFYHHDPLAAAMICFAVLYSRPVSPA